MNFLGSPKFSSKQNGSCLVNSALHAAHVKLDFSEWRNHFSLVQHVENKHWLPRFFVLAGRKTKAWIVKSTGNRAGNHTSAIIYSLLTLDFKLNNQYVCNIWMRVIPVAWKLSQWRTQGEGYSRKVYTARLHREVPHLSLPFRVSFLTETVPLSYNVHWQMVLLSHTYSLELCIPFKLL